MEKSLLENSSKTQNKRSKSSDTGIPISIKRRFEDSSGFSFDDVKVHYNSDSPAKMEALAYAQGNNVYLAPGEERHLEHELGHVVQQKQGMVNATGSIHGTPLNSDSVLEREADQLSRNVSPASNKFHPSEPNESQTIQRITLSPDRVRAMFRERVIGSMDYIAIGEYIRDNYISKANYIDIFYQFAREKIESIQFHSFSHGDEIDTNVQSIYKALDEYLNVPANVNYITNQIEDAVNKLHYGVGLNDNEEDTADEQTFVMDVDYHSAELQAFCESDENIMGTIGNLTRHYHGTPQSYKIDGFKVLHQHVTGDTALAFRRSGQTTLKIMAYGVKRDKALKGTGGYDWETRPKA